MVQKEYKNNVTHKKLSFNKINYRKLIKKIEIAILKVYFDRIKV